MTLRVAFVDDTTSPSNPVPGFPQAPLPSPLGANGINLVLNDGKNPLLNACDGTANYVLKSYDFLAGSLPQLGSTAVFRAWGRSANNVNAKDVRLRIFGVDQLTLALTASIVCPWEIELRIQRRVGTPTSGQQSYLLKGIQNGLIVQVALVLNMNLSLSDVQPQVVTSAAAGDVIGDGTMTELIFT